jgi:hypothetical protein
MAETAVRGNASSSDVFAYVAPPVAPVCGRIVTVL